MLRKIAGLISLALSTLAWYYIPAIQSAVLAVLIVTLQVCGVVVVLVVFPMLGSLLFWAALIVMLIASGNPHWAMLILALVGTGLFMGQTDDSRA